MVPGHFAVKSFVAGCCRREECTINHSITFKVHGEHSKLLDVHDGYIATPKCCAGDGTVLWTCGLFDKGAVPPLVPFAMGSLGFMVRARAAAAAATAVVHLFGVRATVVYLIGWMRGRSDLAAVNPCWLRSTASTRGRLVDQSTDPCPLRTCPPPVLHRPPLASATWRQCWRG